MTDEHPTPIGIQLAQLVAYEDHIRRLDKTVAEFQIRSRGSIRGGTMFLAGAGITLFGATLTYAAVSGTVATAVSVAVSVAGVFGTGLVMAISAVITRQQLARLGRD